MRIGDIDDMMGVGTRGHRKVHQGVDMDTNVIIDALVALDTLMEPSMSRNESERIRRTLKNTPIESAARMFLRYFDVTHIIGVLIDVQRKLRNAEWAIVVLADNPKLPVRGRKDTINDLFVRAAQAGSMAILVFLYHRHADVHTDDDAAVRAAEKAGDDQMMHSLLLWGADERAAVEAIAETGGAALRSAY